MCTVCVHKFICDMWKHSVGIVFEIEIVPIDNHSETSDTINSLWTSYIYIPLFRQGYCFVVILLGLHGYQILSKLQVPNTAVKGICKYKYWYQLVGKSNTK